MKEIRLLTLELKNFKGIKELEIELNGNDLNIYGQNETGKSTIADAWYWLLFHKNSKDQSTQKFNIKPINPANGEVEHGLETVVKGTLQIDDSQLTLKKKYQEVWQKKRGSNEKHFNGHTTDYYVSGAKVKKSEYEQEIEGIIDEEIFRLLTDPLYFNEQLHWTDRREVLLQLTDGLSDEEVMEQDESLKQLAEALEKHDIDRHKESLRREMNGLNDDIEKIPVRIDEVNNNLPDIDTENIVEQRDRIQDKIESIKDEKTKLENRMVKIDNGGELAEKKKRLTEIEGELQEIKNQHAAEYDDKIIEKKEGKTVLEDTIRELESEKIAHHNNIQKKQTKIDQLEAEMNNLRQEFAELNEEKDALLKKDIEVTENCPTCGQRLPENQIQEAAKKARQQKAERIENIAERQKEISQVGKEKKGKVEVLNKSIDSLIEQIKGIDEDIKGLKNNMNEINDDISELQAEKEKYRDSFDYKKKLSEKKNVRQTIESLKADKSSQLQEIDEEINQLEEQIQVEQDKLQEIRAYEKGQSRIEELKKEEKELAKKYQELEKELYLCEKFERTRAKLLEEKVNDLFDMADFKLFEKQINGGINETCQTLYKGVPFNTGLNDGNRIKVGLDIIKTLSEHYGVKAPIFVDNAESITGELEIENQLIKLIVSPGVNELQFKAPEEEMREAS